MKNMPNSALSPSSALIEQEDIPMTHRQKRGLCWLIALLMTAAMMLFVLFCTDITFAANDDSSIMRAFMGYETGKPARTHLFIHGLLAQPLGLLGEWFPGLPWFTYVQLALLALSCTVIAKSIMQCFVKQNRSLLFGAAAAAVFLLVLCMRYVTFLTFTQTAAMLAAAACAQMLSIEHDRGAGHVIAGMSGALALVCLGYALRQNTLLPAVGFCGVIYAFSAWEYFGSGRSLRPMLLSLAVIAAVLAGMTGVRQLELSRPEMKEYLSWQEANTELMDYTEIRTLPQEAFDAVGWDENSLAMAERWCFLDPAISTEAFRTLTEYLYANNDASAAEKLNAAWKLFAQTASENPLDMRCLAVGLLAALLCLLGACAGRRRRLALLVLAMTALTAAMTAYLALDGRLPLRALLVAALPFAAISFAALPAALPERGKLLPAACCVLIAAMGLWCLWDTVPALLIDEEEKWTTGNALTDLEEYAAYEPESLFLYDMSLTATDTRAFPPFPDGIPHNVSFWGGWPLRSPQSVEQFAAFDIDLMNFEPRDLLRDNVFVASAAIDPPPVVLLNWLQTEVSPNIECELYAEYGYAYIFHFYEY